ncbi:hypothetical protein Tco_0181527, partial [Tanacetum coccineum]
AASGNWTVVPGLACGVSHIGPDDYSWRATSEPGPTLESNNLDLTMVLSDGMIGKQTHTLVQKYHWF